MKAVVKLSPKIELHIEEQKEMETLHKAIVLANPRMFCNVCQSTGPFYLTTNKSTTEDGTFTYINYKCKCGARSKLGQYKASGYFWHDFVLYQPKPKGKE